MSNNHKQAELENINKILENNQHPYNQINSNSKKHQNKCHGTLSTKHGVTFTYLRPQARKITNLFKNTEIHVAFKTSNTIWKHIKHQSLNEKRLKTVVCTN